MVWEERLIRIPVKYPVEDGHPQNPDIEPGGPVGDVVEIVLDAFAQGGIAAPAVDLRPAGDPGFDAVADHVVGNSLRELADEYRALGSRPDQAHVSFEHVPKLGQLIEAGAAHEGAQKRSAGIV